MLKIQFVFWYFLAFVAGVFGFLNLNLKSYPNGPNPGYASFVTPFIESGDIAGGQRNCTVKPLKGNIKSYAGFFTVKNAPTYKSNMFFWYFPALSGPNSPVVLWLQGGPGSTSLYGLFEENGPFYVKPKRGLKLRDYSWIRNVSLLYIDNPVGTGFSFTTDRVGYAKNETDVANNLFNAVLQFFTLFPELQKNSFYISGESYAGKYVPALAVKIDSQNKEIKKPINLKGITIGNGLCDPEHMMSYGKYLYELGLIDNNGLTAFQSRESRIVRLIQQNQFKSAFKEFDALLNGDLIAPLKSLFYNLTGFVNYFNYRYPVDVPLHGDFAKFIQSDVGRQAIHVGDHEFHTDSVVEQHLIDDVMRSVRPLVESLLEKNYKVLFYNGQLDIIVAYPLTQDFISNLNWSGKSALKSAQRNKFIVNNQIAGYYRKVNNFVEMLIRDAGHMVPKDQPLWSLELITKFTYGLPPF